MKLNKKAQGTIEYLIIIAIVVVIALVVVNLLFEIMSSTSSINEPTARSNWRISQPWAIVDWSMNSDGNIFLVIKNNSNETMGFNSITLDGEIGNDVNNTPARVTPSATIIRIVPTSYTYPAGSRFSINKEDIIIDFNSGAFPFRKQIGNSEITGTVQ